jgi:hypothetical protein
MCALTLNSDPFLGTATKGITKGEKFSFKSQLTRINIFSVGNHFVDGCENDMIICVLIVITKMMTEINTIY